MWFPPLEGLARAGAAARKALDLDEGLAAAHIARGTVVWFRDWDWSEAEREFRKALDLNPGYVWGHQIYADLLLWRGRLEEAVAEMRLADRLDPFWVSMVTVDFGLFYALQGRGDDALAAWERALERAPSYYRTHEHIGNYYCGRGMPEKGIPSLERASRLSAEDPHIVADLGYCYAISRMQTEARDLLRELEQLSRNRYVSPMALALIHLGLGEHDEAFRELERAYELHAPMLTSIRMDTRYHALGSDPRFQDLLRRIGFPES